MASEYYDLDEGYPETPLFEKQVDIYRLSKAFDNFTRGYSIKHPTESLPGWMEIDLFYGKNKKAKMSILHNVDFNSETRRGKWYLYLHNRGDLGKLNLPRDEDASNDTSSEIFSFKTLDQMLVIIKYIIKKL